MKIALTGAHGTGKTTLSRELTKRLAESNYGPTVAASREVPRVIIDGLDEPEFFRRGNNSLVRQLLILIYQIIEDDERRKEATIVICDRTFVDHLAYTEVLFSDKIGDQERTVLMEAARRWLQTYDKVFYVPIEFAVEDDGVREDDIAFQAAIDNKIVELYKTLNIVPETIRGSVEERATLVMNSLQEDLRQKP